MNFDTIGALKEAGFLGFRSPKALVETLGGIPNAAGVYLVARDPTIHPIFLEENPGGHFKGKSPTVTRAVLEDNWVGGSAVLYSGKAGGATSSSTLRERLNAYLRFGAGKRVGHWGGRFVWQLQDPESLLFCWRESGLVDAAEIEGSLIKEFKRAYGKLPFANLKG